MLAPEPFANYSLSTRKKNVASSICPFGTLTGAPHADPAEFALRRRPADLGHAHRAYRHLAGLWLEPAPCHRPEHVPALAGVCRRHHGHGHGPEQQRHGHARHLVRRPGPDGADPGPGDHARRRCRHRADGTGADPRSVVAVAAADFPRGDFSCRANRPAPGKWVGSASAWG